VLCPAPFHNRQFNTLLTNSTRPRPFIVRINYYNEEYCDVEEIQDYNGVISGSLMLKKQHYTLKNDEHGKKAQYGPL